MTNYSSEAQFLGAKYGGSMIGQQVNYNEPYNKYEIIMDWFSPLNFAQKQLDVYEPEYVENRKAILESHPFKDWMIGRPNVLWCNGLPGSGKTVLTSIIHEHIRQAVLEKPNMGLACIYCDYRFSSHQTPENLLASLWRQLTSNDSEANQLAMIENIHAIHRKAGTRPTLPEIDTLVQSRIQKLEEVYILVDGLDEYSESRVRQRFIECLCQLPVHTPPQKAKVRLFVTSRFKNDIFDTAAEIGAHASRLDIEQFVNQCFEKRGLFQSSSMSTKIAENPRLKAEVVQKIALGAEGIFLAAQLHLRSLESLVNVGELRQVLQDLSQNLNQIYEDAWARISDQKRNLKALAQQTICWLCFAVRRLKVQEVCHALAVQPGATAFDHERLSAIEDVIRACKGLVVVNKQSQTVRFIHSTAMQYFERHQIDLFPEAQAKLTTMCLTYLNFQCFDGEPCEFVSFQASEVNLRVNKHQKIAKRRFLPARLEKFPFLEYAATAWGLHARGNPENLCQDQILQFLMSPNRLANAIMVQTADRKQFEDATFSFGNGQNSPLHVAIWFGLETVSNKLLEQSSIRGVGLETDEGKSALQWAARKGFLEALRTLMGNMSQHNTQKELIHLKLDLSINHGHQKLVNFLLECLEGTEISLKTILEATKAENLFVLQAYIDAAKDSACKAIAADFVLDIAANCGKSQSLQFALDNGADINVEDENGHTTLCRTVMDGQETSVKLLLNAGADISVKSEHGLSLLQEAAVSQKVFWARLHILRNLEPFSKTTFQGQRSTQDFESYLRGRLSAEPNPWKLLDTEELADTLHEDSGHEAIIGMLLDKGVDIKERTADGETILHLSVTSVPRVRAVLDRLRRTKSNELGINSKDNQGRTALHYAAATCNSRVMQYLIDNDAEILAKDIKDTTTLHFAVNDPMCALIALKRGCPVHSFDQQCRTPYHYAALIHEASDVVKKMLENSPGFKIEAVDTQRKTAGDYERGKACGSYGRQGFEETTQWIDEMFNRYILHEMRIRFYVGMSYWRSATEKIGRIDQEAEQERTWVVCDDSDDEDYDPSPQRIVPDLEESGKFTTSEKGWYYLEHQSVREDWKEHHIVIEHHDWNLTTIRALINSSLSDDDSSEGWES